MSLTSQQKNISWSILEEENKRKLREQRKKEADARRLKENEERLKRLHEKEEEDRMYREMLKRKQVWFFSVTVGAVSKSISCSECLFSKRNPKMNIL